MMSLYRQIFSCAVTSILFLNFAVSEYQRIPCKCGVKSHCDYVSTWDSGTKEVIVATGGDPANKTYEKWMWDTVTTVLVTNDHGMKNQPLMCYAHSLGKKFGLTLKVRNTFNMTDQAVFANVSAVDADMQRADVLALNFMELIGDCGNAEEHVENITNVIKTIIPGVKVINKNLRVLCIVPWQPPCYNRNCGIATVMSTLCNAVILNVDSFDTYCDEACIAKALVPYTKVMMAIQEYTAEGFKSSQLLLSIPWHGYKYLCVKVDPTLGTKVVCHLEKTMVDGGPAKCEYESSRTRVDIPTLFIEHPHLAFDEDTYSRVDQAPFFVKNEGNKTYMIWFEDIGSLTDKYKIVNDNSLGGLVIYTAEDLTYGTMPAKDKFNTNMWNWLLHSILISASSGTAADEETNYAGTIAGIGVGMFLFGCLMGSLIACVIFRKKRTLHPPFHQDKIDVEYQDDDDNGL